MRFDHVRFLPLLLLRLQVCVCVYECARAHFFICVIFIFNEFEHNVLSSFEILVYDCFPRVTRFNARFHLDIACVVYIHIFYVYHRMFNAFIVVVVG